MDIKKRTAENAKLWEIAKIKPSFLSQANAIADRIIKNKARYSLVESATGIPWFLIGCLHNMEGSGSFSTWLANGDPLTAPTVRVPKGLGKGMVFPLKWEDAAILSLRHERWKNIKTDIPSFLMLSELYNGAGYANRGMVSPYLWSGTDQYVKGKYTADSKFDPEAVSKQVGVVTVLKALQAKGVIAA
jgi:lysozyme family protein